MNGLELFGSDLCECGHIRASHGPTGCFYVPSVPPALTTAARCGCDRFRLRVIHQAEMRQATRQQLEAIDAALATPNAITCTPTERWHSLDPDFNRIITRCLEVLKAKGADYTIGNLNGDRLHNFRAAANFCHMTPTQALGVYLYKHMAAIFAYIHQGKVESEPIEERIVDAINYLLLLGKLVAEPKKEQA